MDTDLILEIGTEEIPAGFLANSPDVDRLEKIIIKEVRGIERPRIAKDHGPHNGHP